MLAEVVADPLVAVAAVSQRLGPGAGEPVVKYGSPIGTASADIAAGSHVHTHNLASTRGRGDLAVATESSARIAEPPDSAGVNATAGADR